LGNTPIQTGQHMSPIDFPTVMKPLASNLLDDDSVFVAQAHLRLSHRYTSVRSVETAQMYQYFDIYVSAY